MTFVLWGSDKYFAVTRRWRIPEKVLGLAALFGGATGALAGMLVFRHKIRNTTLKLVVIFSVIVQGACLIFVA